MANRTGGAARGRRGKVGTLAWRDDPDILRRVELVGSLYHCSGAAIHRAVNEMLEREDKPPVALSTVWEDRRRALELWRARASTGRGVEMRLAQIQEVLEETWQRLREIPPANGQSAAALLAVALRCVEDAAKLDGSWGAGAIEANVSIDTSSFGKSPLEQLQSGEISEDEYMTALRVLHAHTNAVRP